MLLSLLLITGLVPPTDARSETVRIERHLTLMGTTLMISVEAGDRRAALAASDTALAALQRAERRLSTWTNESEVARLNEAEVGEPVILSSELSADLNRARQWWAATDGAFDPGKGKLSEIWGLRVGGKKPNQALLDQVADVPGLEALDLDGSTAVRRHPELSIDEGGFGKGAGLDDAIRKLKDTDATAAMINLGGQVALFGSGTPVRFEVADPLDRKRTALTLTVDRGALATSGNSERNLVIGERTYSHILDPRSGKPVPDFGSLTVWADNALVADCLSTGLYVLGPDGAIDWAEKHEGIEVLVLEATPNGLRTRATTGMKPRIDTDHSTWPWHAATSSLSWSAFRFGPFFFSTDPLFSMPAPPSPNVYLSVGEALELAFPDCEIVRRTVYLTRAQQSDARRRARIPIESLIVYPYLAVREGQIVGVAYFDSHVVRTLDETIMVALDRNGAIRRVELLAFNEPPEYIPPDAWYRLFSGQRLNDRLAVNRDIRGVLGATLTTHSTTDAARRMLAIHHVIKDQLEH